jgi:hypothetical protein
MLKELRICRKKFPLSTMFYEFQGTKSNRGLHTCLGRTITKKNWYFFTKVLSEYMEICGSPKNIKTECIWINIGPTMQKEIFYILYYILQYNIGSRDGMSKNISASK